MPLRIIIAVLLIIEIYPMVWLLLGSFKTQTEFLNDPFWSLPDHPQSATTTATRSPTGASGHLHPQQRLAVFPSLP